MRKEEFSTMLECLEQIKIDYFFENSTLSHLSGNCFEYNKIIKNLRYSVKACYNLPRIPTVTAEEEIIIKSKLSEILKRVEKFNHSEVEILAEIEERKNLIDQINLIECLSGYELNISDNLIISGRAENNGIEFELNLIVLDDGSNNSRGLTILHNIYNKDIFKLHIDTNSLYHENLVLFADDISFKIVKEGK